MDERSDYRWLVYVGVGAAVLCLALIAAYYLRTNRSFTRDWSGDGLLGKTEPAAPPGNEPSASDVAPSEGET